jgi:hypothetical protein
MQLNFTFSRQKIIKMQDLAIKISKIFGDSNPGQPLQEAAPRMAVPCTGALIAPDSAVIDSTNPQLF